MKDFESLSIGSEDYRIIKIAETFGGNLIIEIENINTGEPEQILMWKKGY